MLVNTIKAVTGLAVSFGVTEVVNNAVRVITPDNIDKVRKVYILVGGMAIAVAVNKIVTDEIDEIIDIAAGVASLQRKKKESNEINIEG